MEITTARIVNSSQIELVVLSYEIIIEDLNNGMKLINENKEEKINFINAKNFIKDLRKALDMKYDISKNLKMLYDYMEEKIIMAEITNDIEKTKKNISDVLKIANTLYSAFKKISEEEKEKETVMVNSTQVYSGLTYGVNGLNETILNDSRRGLIG